MSTTSKSLFRRAFLVFIALTSLAAPVWGADPHSAYYSPDTDKVLWFIHASDTHIGTSGSTDATNLQWLTGQAKTVISPSFIVVSGDLTDSTNGNIFGYPNGPYQSEWDQYKSILGANGIDAGSYFDLPGNHDAYNDQYFRYYLNNSVQGRATGRTQASWTRSGGWGKYLFLGVNTADNTGKPFSLFSPYGDYAGLDTSELSFIQGQMTANQDAQLTLIFGHHPLVATGTSTDTYLYYGREQFVTLMNGNRSSLYGYGHTHASSQAFFNQNMSDGIFYFNISAMGKNSPNQYAVTAIDCNGISSVIQAARTWPVVLITAPLDLHLGGGVNPFTYTVTNGASNPVRALVFDPGSVTTVQFRVNGGAWRPMAGVPGNTRLWQGAWDASALAQGEYAVEVQAVTASGTRSDAITTYVTSPIQPPPVGVTSVITGKYVTSGGTRTFSAQTSFRRGDAIVFRSTVAASGTPVSGATVQLAVRGPSSTSLASGASNSSGTAEATWTTTAPNWRGQGGTPVGSYSVTLTGVTAAGYLWDGVPKGAAFTLQ